MNKLFIVILAVSLVVVNSAVVKREADTGTNIVDDFKKKVDEFGKSINEGAAKVFDPEQLKKTFNEGIDNITKMITDLRKDGEAKQ